MLFWLLGHFKYAKQLPFERVQEVLGDDSAYFCGPGSSFLGLLWLSGSGL